MDAKQATFKGSIIKGAKKWILEHFEEEGYQTFLQHLPEEDRPTWENPILTMAQKPASMYRNHYEAVVNGLGQGDQSLFEAGAGFVALEDISSFMKIFIKIGTPAFVASRFPKIYTQYFNTGELVITNSSSHTLTLELRDAQVYGLAGCTGTIGWTRKALEHSGAKNLMITHQDCAMNGKVCCVIKYSWK